MKRKNIKAAVILIVLAIVFVAAGCSIKDANGDDPFETDLDDIVGLLYKGVDVPAYEIIDLNKDTFKSYAFIDYDTSYKAVAADALVNITPHSLVVIKVDGNAKDLAEDVIVNADPNKWLCVGSEKVSVAYTDNYIVLVMSDEATVDAIIKNFQDIAQALDDMDANILSTGNERFE
ncbi:MAG: hypothetical protein MJ148_01025 [Clostridia bacterium]|nr:hypothetical protein [Clostridia bacterium]